MLLKLVFFILVIVHYSLVSAKEKIKSFEDTIVDYNVQASTWFDERAKWLDLTLSGAKYTKVTEDSQAIISQRLIWKEGDGFTSKTDFDLKLKMPNLEKKYKIIFSSYNENDTRRSNYTRYRVLENEEPDYGANLAFFSKIGDFDVTFQPRLRISDPFETFYNLKFESEVKMKNETFGTRFDFYADSEKGLGQFIALKYRKSFWGLWGHSVVLEEDYQDGRNYFILLQGYSIHRRLTDRMVLTQSFVFTSNNAPITPDTPKTNFQLKDISVGPAFTHEVLPNVFHYSIIYTHWFNREFDFQGRNAASIVLDFIF